MSTYPAIRIEGGLLGPETFDQLMAAELPGQKPDDFGLPAKMSLTDEIAAVFADARALWGVFQNRLQRVPDNDPATSVTRDAWVVPFLGLLGFEPQFNAKAYDVEGRSFPISHRADAAEDSPPLHIVGARQELGRVPESGRPRIAPHTLVQEYLNRTEQLWGVVTNGLVLRLLRDCTFVRRQAYVEFDLETIVDEQRFQDFAVLYRLLHRTRMPCGAADAADCLLEKYYATSVEQGGRVRDHLHDGVKECITRLANGFLAHPANDTPSLIAFRPKNSIASCCGWFIGCCSCWCRRIAAFSAVRRSTASITASRGSAGWPTNGRPIPTTPIFASRCACSGGS